MINYYIASPRRAKKHIDRIQQVEAIFNNIYGINKYYSPYRSAIEFDNDKELNKLRVKSYLDNNLDQINLTHSMIAIVGEFDNETAFEIGYFIGKWDCNPFEISNRLILIDDVDGKFSCIVDEVISNLGFIEDAIQVVDVSDEDPLTFMILGALYAYKLRIVTWSDKVWDSNLLEAYSAFAHYQYPTDGSYTLQQLRDLISRGLTDASPDKFEENFNKLFKGKNYNLGNIKFKDKTK